MKTFTRASTAATILFLTLSLSPAQAQTNGSRTPAFDDPRPQHYKLTARASEIDDRVQPHPEIGFLIGSNGKPVDTEHASVDTRVAPRGRLVIGLMGHNEKLFDRLNSYGLQALRVHYANQWFSLCCQEQPVGENCRGDIRLEAATGQDFSKDVTDEAKQPTQFQDRTSDLGLELSNSAACWVDLNNDGWPDLCTGGTVWQNNSGKRFTKLAEGLGEVVAADFDNDGFTDLFSYSTLKLFHNQEGKTFVPVDLPKLPPTVALGAAWGDFNGDGFVDLYVGGYEDWANQITYPDLLLLNESGSSFQLAWTNDQFRARGVTACDFDRDGDLDVYVSNYRLQPNNLWINDGAAKFSDGAASNNAVGTTAPFSGGHSIGSAWGDFDNDGLFDLFAGNFAHRDTRGDQPQSRFLKNLGGTKQYTFEDLGPCGVFYQESYATPSASDYDNDGDLDLFFTTVYETASFGKKNNAVLYRNAGKFQFEDATEQAQVANLPATYQAAWADFDQDGDLDLVTAGKLFQNNSAGGHWLEVRLVGDGPTINRSAIGAQVRIASTDRTLTRQIEAGTGQGNQNDLTLHFGLGDQAEPVSLEILWPSGVSQVVDGVAVDRLIEVSGK